MKLRYLLLSDPDVAQRLRIIVARNAVDRVVETLHQLGAIQVEKPRLVEGSEEELIKNYLRELEEAHRILRELLRRLGKEDIVVQITPPKPEKFREELRNVIGVLSKVYEEVRSLEHVVEKASSELGKVELLLKVVEILYSRFGDVEASQFSFDGRHVITRTYVVSRKNAEHLRNVAKKYGTVLELGEVSRDKVAILFTTLTMFGQEVEHIAKKLEAEKIALPRGRLSNIINELKNERARLQKLISRRSEISEIIYGHLKELALLKLILDNEWERVKAVSLAVSLRYAAVIEGWVPSSSIRRFVDTLRREIGAIYIEVVKVGEEPPVELQNPRPFKPFELITRLYGLPSRNEWDPTPIFAYFFIIFYSLMLGDAAYGFGLLLATRYVLPKLTENPESEGFISLQKILYVAGSVTIIVGVLSKTFLGPQPWLPYPAILRLGSLNSAPMFIGLSLLMGITHITIAHAISLAKGVVVLDRARVLNELGILLLILFGAPYVLHIFNLVKIPLPQQVLNYIFLPLVLAGISMIVVGKLKTFGAAGSMLWIFDVTGILGDTLSYVRIAGIGLATLLLALVFNMMLFGIFEYMTNVLGIVGMFVGIIVMIVLGGILHVFNLAIGALGSFIHSLRLVYVEFATKFYEGGGREFKPLKIVLRRYITLSP